MKPALVPVALMLIAAPLPLRAQSGSGSDSGGGSGTVSGMAATLTDPAAIGQAAQKAADQLSSKARGKVLASEMIGREVTGPGGEAVGTVEDLVVVPGGQVLAVLIRPSGGGQAVALPYGALKVSAASAAADKMGLSLPVTLEEAGGIEGLQALTKAVTGG